MAMECHPSTEQLYSLRDSRLGWAATLAELIDNSLDAGAARVEFAWKPNRAFDFTDNGPGVPLDDMERLFQQGRHVPHARRGGRVSGEFGVGFMHATGWLWGRLAVRSWIGGQRGDVSLLWDAWARSRSWTLPSPIIEDLEDDTLTGLWIECQDVQKPAPSPADYQRLVDELAFRFAPALRHGAQIQSSYRGQRQAWIPFKPPQRTDVIEGTIVVAGKPVTISVGIVPSGIPNPRQGLHYYRAHRLVLEGSTLGCGQANTSRIFGWVELDRSWKLAVHKDQIEDPALDDLSRAVEAFIQPVLQKAGTMAEVLELKDMETELSTLLQARLHQLSQEGREDREKRGPATNGGGRREPRETGRERVRARQRQMGDHLLKEAKHGGIRVRFDELPLTKGVGYVERQPLCIHINKVQRDVARILKQRRNTALGGVYQIAISLLAFEASLDDQADRAGQLKMEFIRKLTGAPAEKFSLALARFLAILEDER